MISEPPRRSTEVLGIDEGPTRCGEEKGGRLAQLLEFHEQPIFVNDFTER